jgi:hypothetical protein
VFDEPDASLNVPAYWNSESRIKNLNIELVNILAYRNNGSAWLIYEISKQLFEDNLCW